MKETYFELDGNIGAIIPKESGGFTFQTYNGGIMAEFMRDGTIISKEKYQELEKQIQAK